MGPLRISSSAVPARLAAAYALGLITVAKKCLSLEKEVVLLVARFW